MQVDHLGKSLRISKKTPYRRGWKTNPLPIKPINLRLSVKVKKKNTIKISEENIQLDCKTHKDGGGIVWASQNHCTTLRA